MRTSPIVLEIFLLVVSQHSELEKRCSMFERCKPIWLPIKAHRFAAYRAKVPVTGISVGPTVYTGFGSAWVPCPGEVLQLLPQRVLQQYIDFEKQGQCDTKPRKRRSPLVRTMGGTRLASSSWNLRLPGLRVSGLSVQGS